MVRLNVANSWMICLPMQKQYQTLTDRQTDRQTNRETYGNIHCACIASSGQILPKL